MSFVEVLYFNRIYIDIRWRNKFIISSFYELFVAQIQLSTMYENKTKIVTAVFIFYSFK